MRSQESELLTPHSLLLTQKLLVSEVFYSIQGESLRAGYPCVFFRLAGCNLRCRYCDARYTYEEPGQPKGLGELLAYAERYPAALVEITGGEPLLQENCYPLMAALLAAGRTVLLETNGSLSLARVPAGVTKIMDLKCPDSGMHERMDLANLQYLSKDDEIKFVLSSPADYTWARQMLTTHDLAARAAVTFSPVAESFDPAELARMILQDRLPVRLQLQLHKVIWPGAGRGV